MFKKFSESENVTGTQQLKSSVQKSIRNKLLEQFPTIGPFIDSIMPKKDNFKLVKCSDHVELVAGANGDILFFKSRDSPYLPTLRLLHKYPFMLPWQQVDKGAIKFVLRGSNIMCPGLTSSGGHLIASQKGEPVAIMCEGKQHALALGLMSMDSDQIQNVKEGVAIETLHYMNDGLWLMKPVR